MPIVVGVGRSGTTLLRLMLDAHPDLAMTHETGFIPALHALGSPLHRGFYSRLRTAVQGHGWAGSLREQFLRLLTSQPNWSDFHIDREQLRESLTQLEPFNVSDGLRIFFRLYAARFGKPRWGDKTPNYCLHLGTIEQILPESRFIHIIRDGRDVSLSVRGLHFAPGRDMETLASHWVRTINAARLQSRRCSHYLEVRYEDLVLDTTTVLRKICAFAGLDYDAGMEKYYKGAPVRINELEPTRDRHGNVLVTRETRQQTNRLTKQPPQPDRVARWKSDMTQDERATFTRIAGALLEDLGYEV
jgi:hypothetical protein